MKTFITLFTLSLAGILSAQTHQLKVEVSNIKNSNGNIRVGLYNSESGFLKKSLQGKIGKITGNKTEVTFDNLPKGEYAISLYHDENNNGKLDKGLLGIPKEDYGCSNNATGFMGPPKYEDAKFRLEKDTTINISIK